MRIYHNIPALTAYNSLNSTNSAMEKSIQKLSTGLRINSAADDAAGFAISEKMRSQISGLEVAIRNTQDATSMLQVAEGALGETNSMLQRMRELAVQASNDTLTSQDRSYIQLEIDQLEDQIDRIAKTTQFNKKRLLDGSSAGITSSSNQSVKVYVRGSLREIDQFGQKKSFEGNYKISVKVDPSQTGTGQVQKSSVMTIKHPNVVTDVVTNTGVQKVAVDNVPAGDYKVNAADISEGSVKMTGAYNTSTAEGATAAGIKSAISVIGTDMTANASVLFEVVSKNDDNVTLRATSNVLTLDGNVENYLEDEIIVTASGINVGDKLGIGEDAACTITLNADALDLIDVGTKFVYNFTAASESGKGVSITGEQDKFWPDKWGGEPADPEAGIDWDEHTYSVICADETGQYEDVDPDETSLKYGLDYGLTDKEIHFRNFYLNGDNGSVYEGDVILTTDSEFFPSEDNNNIEDGDLLTSFTAAYIGKTATLDTKLRDLNVFWNTSGVFMLDNPQTITINQGDGKTASVTIYGTDTIRELQAKFNQAIGVDLGQAQYVEGSGASKFCTFVEQGSEDKQGIETVPGTFIFRSILPGSNGDLTFTGDEDLINTFALNVVKESSTAAFRASIYDAHTGTPIATNVKVSDNKLVGVLHENVDIEFDATANIKATWSENEKNFILEPESEAYEAIIHIVDSSTVFQIGANEGEDIAIDIGNMSAASLGVTNINVSTRETASKAIGLIDAAINKVSSQRAKIGAYQNALEYTSENLTTTMTNLTAAESRIRDVDMAQEMMNFVKLQILNQSGTSMLAQANQLPQSVLSLLQ